MHCLPIERLLGTAPSILGECNGVSAGGGTTIDSRPARFFGSEVKPLSIAGPMGSNRVGDICDQFSGLPFGHVGYRYSPVASGIRVKRYLGFVRRPLRTAARIVRVR